jgi:hypothetical protein
VRHPQHDTRRQRRLPGDPAVREGDVHVRG